MAWQVEGIVRNIQVEGGQIRFTFDGSDRRVAAKDFDLTIREGDWASITGGDNSLGLRPGEHNQLVSFIAATIGRRREA